ncbi:hypothetical protein [Streptomyces brasiliscabiei]|uniref:hypothetical protein n=1 Tax=Streptomyces brasiliscabiei TaxID=2736302 RepID=UPI001C100D5F|nr:hypothetical protein [Streptomyces brasiliscabiei]
MVLLVILACLCLISQAHAQGGSGTGSITITVGWDRSRQEVVVGETCRYELAAHSEAAAALRKDGVGRCGGYRMLRQGKPADLDGWSNRPDTVTQAGPDEPLQVRSTFASYLARRDGAQDVRIVLDMQQLAETHAAGSPTAWTMKVSAPKWLLAEIRGPLDSQSANAVVWHVSTVAAGSKKATPVDRSVTLVRTEATTKPPSARQQTRAEMLAVFAVAVCGIGLVAALLVARLAGRAVPRRWAAATMVLAAATGLCACLGIPEPLLPPNVSVVPISITVGGGGPSPGTVWTPGPVLGLWLWYVLPLAGWWFTRRVVTRRPPSRRILLISCLSPVGSFLLMAADGTVPRAPGWVRLGTAVLLALLALLVFRHVDEVSAIRRWASTLGALAWTAAIAIVLGQSPIMAANDPDISYWETAAVLVCTWPMAAWLTSLIGPVLRRAVGIVPRAVCFVVLWATLVSPFVMARLPANRLTVANPLGGYQQPFFTGYATFPLFVAVVCGVALQLAYLLRRGAVDVRAQGAEPVGRILLVCGVLVAVGIPTLRMLSMWGQAAAVLVTALGTLLVLPVGASVTSAKFQRVSRAAHARFMDRWVIAQLVWDTRADFQRAARSALAEDMLMAEFSDRWRELDVPGRIGDPAKRLARVRRFALGTSAGTAPRRAGLASAAAALALALPWATYKLLTTAAVGGDPLMPFHLDALSKALRFGHWALYGFVFGYFYALLRGVTPVGKAALLMLALVPAEMLLMLPLTIDPQYTADPSWTGMVAACGGVAGQTVVVCMGLGLGWEWWLARAAGMKWSQVRNFRRLSSITVPAGTVLVAAATAFATTVAGTWAQPASAPSTLPAAVVPQSDRPSGAPE